MREPNVDGKEDKKAKRELRKKSRQAGKDDSEQRNEERAKILLCNQRSE